MVATHRPCTKCGETKALTEFSPHAHGKYGRQSRCKACYTKANCARYWANLAVARERSRLRSLKEQIANPAKRRAQRDAWIARNPELNRESKRKWAAANPEKIREKHRRRDFEKNKAYTRAHRARKRSNGGVHTPEDIERLLVEQASLCVYCRRQLRRYEVDHRTPTARGGSNGPENLQLLCGLCNRSKGARTHEEHLEHRSKHMDNFPIEHDKTPHEAHRLKLGRIQLKCGCGAVVELDAKRPDDAPKPLCGVCGKALQ